MSYATYEMSREDGAPVSLYLLTWGDAAGSYYAYTDHDAEVSYDGKTYTPIAIGRDKVESSGTLDRKQLQIDLTPNASVVQHYAQQPPTQKVGLIIRQGHMSDGDGEFTVVWSGVVKAVVREQNGAARILAEPLDSLLARPGLRRHYMLGCPYVLYDVDTCMADKELHRRDAAPVLVGQNYAKFASGWNGATEASAYLGGYMQWTDAAGNTQTRSILVFGADDTELVIGNAAGLTTGITVAIYAGCNHKLGDCLNLHDNVVNFGGQPYIPLVNPIGRVNQFY